MILVTFALIIIGLFLFLLKALYFTYMFQIKEYRFDRLLSTVREMGVFQFLYGIDFRLPAKKIRNMGITGITGCIGLISPLFLINLPLDELAYLFVLIPLFAFTIVSLLVGVSQIPVRVYRERLIALAASKLEASDAERIAITGSYGKTSVKEFLYELLKPHFHVMKTDKNMNTDVGVAISILKHLKKNTEICIIEMGAYRTGEIAKICSYVHPQKVIVTAFGNQHVDLYGSKDILVAAESEPLSFIGLDGVAYINKDIPEYEKLTSAAEFTTVSYSLSDTSASIYATGISADAEGTKATVHYKGKSFPLQTKLLGKHTIQNLLPVIAYVMDRGVGQTEIQKSIRHLEPIPAKLSIHSGYKKATVINDSNNSNVEGFIEAIHILDMFPNKKKLIVSKGIIELGSEKKASYTQIGDTLRETDSRLYTTDEDFKLSGKASVTVFATEEELLHALLETIDAETVVLLEGRFSEHFIKKLL